MHCHFRDNVPMLVLSNEAPRHESSFGSTAINSETTDATDARAALDQMPGIDGSSHAVAQDMKRYASGHARACVIGIKAPSANDGNSLRSALLEQAANSST
jgi:hypothetical protein